MTAVPRDRSAIEACGVELNLSKQVGMMTLPTANASKLAAVCATVWLKNCSWRLSPPKKKHIPMTRSKLERMLPIRDVWTTTTSSLVRAMTATISSTALLDKLANYHREID
jgi:hypothetical protein